MDEQKLAERKQEFERISESLSKSNELSEDVKQNWQKPHDNIMRRFELFSSDKIFIVATGMLKAGKSTLVNLLARNPNASPIGFGVDTTLRPALIKMADEAHSASAGIYVYKPQPIEHKKPADGASEEAIKKQYEEEERAGRQQQLQNIVDFIRGRASLARNLEVAPIPLNQDNLRKALCEEPNGTTLDQEPLLVVVEVPYNEDSKLFVENNCVIFDMPGLDSHDAAVAKDFSAYNAIFNECDLVLFIQSDVAPLNGTACGYLKQIGETRDGCTYRLVQNRMNARYWRQGDVIKRELDDHAATARKNFVKKLDTHKVTEESLISWSANLGMAYDAIFKPNELRERQGAGDVAALLKAESDFFADDVNQKGLEYHLCDDIKRNGEVRRKQHCKDALINELNTVCESIKGRIRALDDEKTQKGNEKAEVSRQLDGLDGLSQQAGNRAGITFAVSDGLRPVLEEAMRAQFDKVRDSEDYRKLLPRTDAVFKGVKGSEYKQFLIDCDTNARDAVKNKLCEAYFEDIFTGVLDGKQLDAIDRLNEKITAINEKLAGAVSALPLIARRTKPLGSSFRDCTLQPTKFNVDEKTSKLLKIITIEKSLEKFESKDLEEEYKRIIDHYIQEVNVALDVKMREIMAETLSRHIEDCLKDKKQELQRSINRLQAEQERLETGKQTLDAAEASLRALGQSIAGLEI